MTRNKVEATGKKMVIINDDRGNYFSRETSRCDSEADYIVVSQRTVWFHSSCTESGSRDLERIWVLYN